MSSEVIDLIEWLHARLDRDERVAQMAKAFRYDLPTDSPWQRERIIADSLGKRLSRVKAVHLMVAVFADPDRVLAEVHAKRQILAFAASAVRLSRQDPDSYVMAGSAAAYHVVLEHLAVTYADQGGYRDGWRP